jgi:hypothetical protein
MKNPTETLPKLINDNGILATAHELIPDDMKDFFTSASGPDNAILIYYHPSGDVDTISYPHPNLKHLRAALYDARESGFIPDVPAVLLPSGEEFLIDA